jgi:hypothetical protein
MNEWGMVIVFAVIAIGGVAWFIRYENAKKKCKNEEKLKKQILNRTVTATL